MIRGYIGLLGMGKTISMVNDSMDFLRKGGHVITNTPFNVLLKSKPKEENPNYRLINGKHYLIPEFIENPSQFKHAMFTQTNCLILIDEASILLSAYDWQKMNLEFIMKFAQARKYGLHIFYTSQGYNHTVKRLRDLTNEIVVCVKRDPFRFQMIENTTYNPEFFANRIIPSPAMENKFVIRRKTLYPWDLKRLYSAYDTMYKVGSNMITNEEKNVMNSSSLDFIK